MRGPLEMDGRAVLSLVRVRRYRCTTCRATQTVGPAEMLTGRLYSLAAMVWALALWGLERLTAAAVRARVSPWRAVGAGSADRWDSLSRWAAVAKRGVLLECIRAAPADWALRQVAARAATTVSAYALPGTGPPSLSSRAFLGAERAR